MVSLRSDLPLDRDASGRFLPWLIAFMVYLAALAVTAGIAMNKVLVRWDQGLSGRLTVQVQPPPQNQAGRTLAQSVEIVVGLLRETEGVESAEALSDEAITGLLSPWLGEDVLEQDLPLPALIAVTVDAETGPNPAELQDRLSAEVPGTLVDDHQRWLSDIFDLARTIETVASLIVVAVGFSAVVTVVFVTRTGLSIHARVIELLHLIGAQDSYIAKQFEANALRLGLQGGIVGVILAIATVALIGFLVTRSENALLPDLTLTSYEWLIMLFLPLATTLVAMVTARLTVLLTLARLP